MTTSVTFLVALASFALSRAAAQHQISNYAPTPAFKNAEFQGAGAYGLAFVAPSSYGYGDNEAYGRTNAAAGYGFQGPTAAGLGPGKYAFPIFDHNQGYGGFGALGYYGINLGFAYPGYGYGNGVFGARSYPNPFV